MEITLSIVIPIYKNADTLSELTNRIVDAVNGRSFEIVFVIDGSPDNSLEIARGLQASYPEIGVVNLSRNLGQQAAVLVGLTHCSGKFIAVMDGDLQDKPELVPKLLTCWEREGDAVYVKRKGIYQSPARMMTSFAVKSLLRLVNGLHHKAGSFYLFDQSILNEVKQTGKNCSRPYMSIVVSALAKRRLYYLYERGKSVGGSGYSFRKRVKAAIIALNCALYCRKIKSRLY